MAADPIPQITAVDDVKAANQSGKIERLAGRVSCRHVFSCPLICHLRRDMPMSGKSKIRPDLITDHIAVVCLVDIHRLLQLPALPDTSRRTVRGTEDGKMYAVLFQLPIHILIVHPPDPAAVFLERTVNRYASQALNVLPEPEIERAVEEDPVSGFGEHLDRARHKSVDAVLVADMLFLQSGHAEMLFLPADDGIVI